MKDKDIKIFILQTLYDSNLDKTSKNSPEIIEFQEKIGESRLDKMIKSLEINGAITILKDKNSNDTILSLTQNGYTYVGINRVLPLNIKYLIETGLFFAKYSKKYRDLSMREKIQYNQDFGNPPLVVTLSVQNILYFHESVLILNTLLSEEKMREISFSMLFKKLDNNLIKIRRFIRKKYNENNKELKDREILKEYRNIIEKYDEIKKEYDKSDIRKLRNKIFAHKDVNMSSTFLFAYYSPIQKEYIDKIIYFYDKLKEYLSESFDVANNNEFEQLYKEPFDSLYDKLGSCCDPE